MKMIRSHSGMTLTELLISSAMIGIVITGALSADFAIRTWQKRIEQRTLVQMDLARAMEQIVRDIRSTVGHGVLMTTTNLWQTCDILQPGICHDNTRTIIFRLGDHQYMPYTRPNALDLWRGGVTILQITNPNFFKIQLNAQDGRIEYIEITLETRPDPTKPHDALKNPTYSLTTRILPVGLSQ